MVNTPAVDDSRSKKRANAFGFVRLVLASMVILAHTPELADGNRSREMLTRLFGTLSFGEVAVDGFFVLSGFFISSSYLKTNSASDFLLRRVARIYPAFILAWIVCVSIVGPLGGAHPPTDFYALSGMANDVMWLRMPDVQGAFAGRPYPVLNGSMWTIQYEFRCYLLVMALGIVGALRAKSLPVGAALGCFIATAAIAIHPSLAYHVSNLYGARILLVDPASAFRLGGCFFVGISYYHWRAQIKFTRLFALLAVFGLLSSMFFPLIADGGVALCGGYLALYIGRAGSGTVLERINNSSDVSYGIYLYAFPAGHLLLWWFPDAPLFLIGLGTFVVSYLAGWFSWITLEKRVQDWAHRQRLSTQYLPRRKQHRSQYQIYGVEAGRA